MIQVKPFAPWLTAVLAIALGAYFQHTHNAQLAQARAETTIAVEAYHAAHTQALGYELVALAAETRADSIEQARAAAAPRVAAIVKAAPDTCKPVIDALQGQVAQLQAEAKGRKDAFSEQKQATAVLAPAADHVAQAATNLVKASKPSFWAHLKPNVGLGATVGVDPASGKFSKTVGVTFGWKVL